MLAVVSLFSAASLLPPLRSAAPHGRPAPVVARPRGRHAALQMAETIVVTDGSGSFYGSRTVFQTLYDFGDFSSVTASSSDVADAKKMLLSRQARYSGLIDVLQFSDAPLEEALSGASIFLVLNADESQLAAQAKLAKAAGVGRLFALLTPAGPTDGAPADPAALQAALEASGVEFTVMRTGSLGPEGEGGGIKVSDVDEVVCEDVPREDMYRFITEALTLPGAAGRMFSLCPSVDASQLTEMRLAGCTRREEVEALLAGKITERLGDEDKEKVLTDEEKAAEAEAKAKAEAEEEAESADEIAALFARAQKTGGEMKKKQEAAEKAFQEKQAERAEKYALTELGEDALKAEKKGAEEEKDDDPPPPPPEEKDDAPTA